MARKPTRAARKSRADQVTLTIPLTPEGLQRAEARLAELKATVRARSGRELRELMESVQARNADLIAGRTEDELMAEVDELVREVRAERREQQAGP